jgi:hypothetical protein
MAAILGEQEKKADGRLYSYLMANTIVVQFTVRYSEVGIVDFQHMAGNCQKSIRFTNRKTPCL